MSYRRPTTAAELEDLHIRLTTGARQIMLRKNHDYGADGDPFANFHRHGALGILVRMDDKLSRLATFARKGRLDVTEEPVEDAAIDLINYAVLLIGYLGDLQK